jgi:hypothetical protein
MKPIKWAILVLMCLGIAGCNKTDKENTQQQTPALQQPAEIQPQIAPDIQKETPPAVEPEIKKSVTVSKSNRAPEKKSKVVKKPKVEVPVQTAKEIPVETAAPVVEEASSHAVTPPEPAPELPPAKPQPRYATIPGGIVIQVRLQDPLDSGVNLTGDTFRAILDRDIEVGGVLVAPRGSTLDGKISHSERSGRVEGRAAMSLQLTALHIDRRMYPIQTQILSFEAASSQKKDVGKVGIGAGLGAVIGAIAGGGKGAAIGAAVGAGAGGATVLATRGNEVKLESEKRLDFSLQRDVSIQLPND